MKLRSQMLLAGVLTLAVPLVGWQSAKQLYGALQQTRIDEQTLKVANMRLALSEAADIAAALDSGMVVSSSNDWYAETSPYPIFIDGYDDDWKTLVSEAIEFRDDTGALTARLKAARFAERLYLFLSVADSKVVYHSPPPLLVDPGEEEQLARQDQLVNGDSVEFLIDLATDYSNQPNWQHALFRTIAPGPVEAVMGSDEKETMYRQRFAGSELSSWQATWVKSDEGYQLELSLPLPKNGAAMGIAITDVDASGEVRKRWIGNLSPATIARVHEGKIPLDRKRVGLLFHDNAAVGSRLQPWITPGLRARLFDVHGRLIADVNKLNTRNLPEDEAIAADESSEGLWDAILRRVFAFFVVGDLPLLPEYRHVTVSLELSQARRDSLVASQPLTTRYVTDENDRVLGTLAPIGGAPRRGYLLFESNEEHSAAYAGSELARLFSLLLLVSLLAGCGLLIFALILSSRIRHLSRQAQLAVSADGKVRGLPGSDAQDEIGDLSRKLSSLLARSAAYTQYLEALSSRLSHELRTPLSVVKTSIENLDRDSLDEQSRQLIDRASGGAEHLSSIIKALVESTRLEQTVQLADMHSVDLLEWLQGSLVRYQQVYDAAEFELRVTSTRSVSVIASPELLSQAFDKLVDNAVSFSSGGPVVLQMVLQNAVPGRIGGHERVQLSVLNQGVPLNNAILEQLFQPLYSSRSSSPDTAAGELHLGLGLYIVKMIAEAHEGEVLAENVSESEPGLLPRSILGSISGSEPVFKSGWVRIGVVLPLR